MNTRTLPAKDFERAGALFRRRKFVNLVAVALANLAALFGLVFLGWILWTLLSKGLSSLNLDLFTWTSHRRWSAAACATRSSAA